MGVSDDRLMATVDRAVAELDAVLGRKASAMVISGAVPPPRRNVSTQEGPQFLTSRILVAPMVRVLGYADTDLGREGSGRLPGLVVATVPVNHPLSDAVGSLLTSMRREGIRSGIATDGMRWMRAETEDGRARVVCMSDLRPYYIESLDRQRFRVAVVEDRRNLRLFSHMFSKPDQHLPCPQGGPSGEPTSMSPTTDA